IVDTDVTDTGDTDVIKPHGGPGNNGDGDSSGCTTVPFGPGVPASLIVPFALAGMRRRED
ncbi:hypothetical protein KKC94_05550, partial [Patescibacteria group bacterium]|nr:hypothetical protein [Patescibacteria group bacterium]MBU0982126.1 hypothetical protein [Patescibacteria group bacterium]